MNILLVSGPSISLKEPFNSGIESFIVSLANQLVSEGHNVDVIAEEAEDNASFTLIDPFVGSKNSKLKLLKRLHEQDEFSNVNIEKYDVIHYNMFYPHLYKVGARFDKPSFITLHSPPDHKRIKTYRKIAQHTNMTFVAISDRIKSQWEQALNIDIPLICNGINMSLWPVKKQNDRDYLLWSARINEEKNVASAIKLANHMNMPLKIAGRITDQHYFNEQVKPYLNNQIQYIGHVTQQEISTLAQNATAYLATATWQEPFGLAALEMLASGVPVIGFDTAVPPSLQHESVLTHHSHQWQNLISLVESSHDITPAMCREFASHMSIENMTSRYIELYRAAASTLSLTQPTLLTDSVHTQLIAQAQPIE